MSSAIIWLLWGCAAVSGGRSAVPLDPGRRETVLEVGTQSGGDTLSRSLGQKFGVFGVGIRQGLSPDLDMGVMFYLGGVRADLRFRFIEEGPWHVAVAPSLAGGMLTSPGLTVGALQLQAPVIVERAWQQHAGVWVAIEPSTVLRGGWQSGSGLSKGGGVRADQYVGLAAGVRLQRGRVRLGWEITAARSIMHAAPPIWSTGPEIGLLPREARYSRE